MVLMKVLLLAMKTDHFRFDQLLLRRNFPKVDGQRFIEIDVEEDYEEHKLLLQGEQE